MPFFIPFIVGAIAAGSIGTSVANSAMDGALFAPEIKQYKKDIESGKKTNESLISQIESIDKAYNNKVTNLNSYLDISNQLNEEFLSAESKAAGQATLEMLEASSIYNQANSTVQGQLSIVASTAITTLGSVQLQQILGNAMADTQLGKAAASSTSSYLKSAGKMAQQSAYRAMVKAKTTLRLTKVVKIASPVAKAGARIASLGLKTSSAAASRLATKAAGPLGVVLDVALIGLDVHLSKERAKEYKKLRDDINEANRQLRDIKKEANHITAKLKSDEAMLRGEVLNFAKYAAQVILFSMDSLEGLPAKFQDFDRIQNLTSVNKQDLSQLLHYIQDNFDEFFEARANTYIHLIAKYKGYFIRCNVEPDYLLNRVPVLGAFGLEFTRFIYESSFTDDFVAAFVPETCELDLDHNDIINGFEVVSADLQNSSISRVSSKYWVYTDANGVSHPYGEINRDEWSVYLRSKKNSGKYLQLDLWRGELITWGNGQDRTVIDFVEMPYIHEKKGFEAMTAAPFEHDIDRPGQDYRNLQTPNAMACSRECASDSVCQAFTWTPSGNKCWLKDKVPNKVVKKFTHFRSGVKIKHLPTVKKAIRIANPRFARPVLRRAALSRP
ncbi:PAN/Apple domain-containing protein [Pseudobacteriovorax antillogorgiicola]|uniref:PAN domain-containing protein n=1 Tax=Pseudobacteriovorax antillogorgiicola TaxID=1513793 RepID=A0A1Y6CLA4_9BACT|nr:PAN/Apple domain-containing protein [Pseudobacteriovorax antillogorgiicola]TCS45932.1 PAN domain-containing protein [Pseudobacteriovorax antillogorgiicola]SMF71000.1 PAN domain-containing protein [Pseudobacteriovorax antillogorgiicola]